MHLLRPLDLRLLSSVLLVVTVTAELIDQLRYFETLKHVDVKVRRKRSVDSQDSGTKDVSFSAFGREFNLVLTAGSPVISNDFQARVVYRDGRSAPLFVNENDFFTGHLSEDETVKADAHTENGLWTASVYEKEDIYTLEPSWPHLGVSDNHSMIVYRHSDIKWNNIFPDLETKPDQRQKICESLHPEDDPEYLAHLEEGVDEAADEGVEDDSVQEEEGDKRKKRASSGRTTCHIIAVADFTFFSGPGGGFPHRTANYIVQTMQKVNRIYKGTVWDSELGLTNMGMQIKELRIHSEYTDPSQFGDNELHYNMNRDVWPDHDLLKQFGTDKSLHQFCLAHLFTHRQFEGGVLGLAYIASARKHALGGICSSRRAYRAMNTGFSSTKNTRGGNLLTQEAVLVTGHEFGHNWGSEHDAETDECAPSAFNNGKFLMYPFAVSGFDENNDAFSPCSKRYIAAALSTRAHLCFKGHTSNVPLCGNGIIDTGEDCDGGSYGLSDFDPCCDQNCKLKAGAHCSSVNHECCYNCRMAPRDTLCRGASNELCQEESFCSGFSLDCPMAKPKSNDTECIDQGKCVSGQCLDFCTVTGLKTNKHLKPCRCEESDFMCLRCCRDESGSCQPIGGSLPTGRPCSYGYCENGICQKGKANMIQRVFSFIERLDSSTLVAFMKSNIVGTIIVFSLVVWIPVSWIISCIDKRHERKSHMFTTYEEPLKMKESRVHKVPIYRPVLTRGEEVAYPYDEESPARFEIESSL